jgi:predicted nucleic acid-binding protein
MKYLLDTAPLAAYTRGRRGAVTRLDTLIQHQEAATSILNYGEVIEGLLSFPNVFAEYQGILRGLLQTQITVLVPDYHVMDRYAEIRRTMRLLRAPNGQPLGLIGDIDTLIAALPLEHGLTIITTDGDYSRVPGLSAQLLTMAQLRDP